MDDHSLNGILVVDKPYGWTSHDVCQYVKRGLPCHRVGHTGTLDPLATGVLPLLLNAATQWASRCTDHDKEYQVTACFGVTTTTYDAEGDVTDTASVPDDLQHRIARLLPRFRGHLQQAPPPYSAVKYRGRPLYWWARRGQFPTVSPRLVGVMTFEPSIEGVEQLPATHYSFHITCSKGTYIRSLIHALGQATGCGAHVTALRRLRSGPFTLAQAIPWSQITNPKIALQMLRAFDAT